MTEQIIKIKIAEFNENNTKIDTGHKMKRFHLTCDSQDRGRRHKSSSTDLSGCDVVLSAYAKDYVTPNDSIKGNTTYKRVFTVGGINCSWNKLIEDSKDSKSFSEKKKLATKQNARKLPLLYAANSVNYSKPMMLSTAEAIASAVFIGTGGDGIGIFNLICSKFSWGEQFKHLNMCLLCKYANHENMHYYSDYCHCSEEEEVETIEIVNFDSEDESVKDQGTSKDVEENEEEDEYDEEEYEEEESDEEDEEEEEEIVNMTIIKNGTFLIERRDL